MHTSPVTRKFRQFVLDKYPSLRRNEPYLRFFHYLCFSEFFDQHTHHLVLPTKTMAERFCQRPYDQHFNGKAMLERFRAEVLPGLRWSEHARLSNNSWRGKAREIVDLGFDAEMHAALKKEWLDTQEDQVDFITGRDYRRQDRYQDVANETAAYEQELGKCSLNATQVKILGYLRGLNAGHLFIRKLTENRAPIEAAIQQLPQPVQDIRCRILAAVGRNPNVYYLPSSQGRTCRLSASGDSILGLKKEIRRAATKGWWEADLRSSQFAILAARLEAPLAQKFIASGKSIWREFNHHLLGQVTDPSPENKRVMKEVIYSLCFGKSETNLATFVEEHGIPQLLDHPILQELLIRRKKWFVRIKEAGGGHDAWGTWHAWDEDKRWEGAIAATVIQSIEMEIIAPIFDVAAKSGKSDQFNICLFQHDGVTVSFNSTEKTERAQAKLKKAVEERAKQLGVSTVLEFAQL